MSPLVAAYSQADILFPLNHVSNPESLNPIILQEITQRSYTNDQSAESCKSHIAVTWPFAFRWVS